ncbi:GDSL esterase/lipase EXL3-like protein [Tanacetum coccineum]|uniref:GDSL esterase/lipase EXL3-like protein n=1 Tax=Tanacetum coccineum TaxID=301880 RepID=A0ABQ5BWP6_9ASTR
MKKTAPRPTSKEELNPKSTIRYICTKEGSNDCGMNEERLDSNSFGLPDAMCIDYRDVPGKKLTTIPELATKYPPGTTLANLTAKRSLTPGFLSGPPSSKRCPRVLNLTFASFLSAYFSLDEVNLLSPSKSLTDLALIPNCCEGHSKGTLNLPKNVVIPAVIAFGDSIMDQGNNNYIKTVTKANFFLYGKDFVGGKLTGRFSNRKTLADVFAKGLGVKEYLPAYLDPYIQDKDLITGVSFASGGSRHDPLTPTISSVIPLSAQVEMFKDYISKIKRNIGEEAAMNVITECLYFVSASSNNFLVNYFSIPARRLQFDVPAYSNMLVEFVVSFIQDVYKLGARRIAVLSATPIGCVPLERTLAGGAQRICVDKYNKAAQLFNSMLKQKIQFLLVSLAQSRVAYVNFYNPFISFIENPHQYGIHYFQYTVL